MKQYSPQITAVVYKTIGRTTLFGGTPLSERYTQISAPTSAGGLGGRIDLTPWLDEDGGVITCKSTTEPAGGFTITLADKPLQAVSLDTVYAAIEPMDYVELSMSYGNGDQPVIVMRGFVSDVSRAESMGDDGRPQRSVVISGQDFGKLWQLVQTFPLAMRYNDPAQALLEQFSIFQRWGLGLPSVLTANAFVTAAVESGVSAMLAAILPPNMPAPPVVLTDLVEGQGYNVAVQSIGTENETLYQLLHRFADVGIWNELFLDDRPDGVHCVYRPYPALPVGQAPESQAFLRPVANPVEVNNITDADVQSIKISRGDGNIANFYWVDAPAYDMTIGPLTATYNSPSAGPYMNQGAYANCQSRLYGDRYMRAEAMTYPAEVIVGTTGMSKGEIQAAAPNWQSYVTTLQQVLALSNRDNVLLEHGTIVIKGTPAIRAGTFLNMTRGALKSSYYVRKVEHNFAPFRSYTTTLTVERGTGFVDRVTAGASKGAPYSAERLSA